MIQALLIAISYMTSTPTASGAPLPDTASKVFQRLSKAIQFRTVSGSSEDPIPEQLRFQAFLKQSFPSVYKAMRVERIGNSLLFRWLPMRASPNHNAVLFLAHQDVVPVAAQDIAHWLHPPFSGKITESAIWGRGAIDDKFAVLGFLEAADNLIQSGFHPVRPILFGFGSDEETGGRNGALKIANHLTRSGIQIAAIFDEGTPIVEDAIPDLQQPVALIGVAEKGFANFHLQARVEGGHSAIPAKETALGALRDAIERIESANLSPELPQISQVMFEEFGRDSNGLKALALRQIQYTKYFLVPWVLRKQPTMNAFVSTTCVNTVFEGGFKSNVIPNEARATVNCRILPGQSVESLRAKLVQLIRDTRIQIDLEPGFIEATSGNHQPSINTAFFKAMTDSIHKVFGARIKVIPSLLVGSTDSKHFQKTGAPIYRFSPYKIPKTDLKYFHGNNEHISKDNYLAAIRYFRELFYAVGLGSTN